MIVPCIDLMGGKVVQLVQGREKALEAEEPLAMLEKFKAFPQIQVIDLDAAMGLGSNDGLVELVAARSTARVGGPDLRVARSRRGEGDFRSICGPCWRLIRATCGTPGEVDQTAKIQ